MRTRPRPAVSLVQLALITVLAAIPSACADSMLSGSRRDGGGTVLPDGRVIPPDGGTTVLPDGRVVGPGDAGSPADSGVVVPPGTPVEVVSTDVAVFGAGTGGVAAAIQAARLGARVALVEETDWVGGQATAGGVSTMDQGPFANDTGVYAEWIGRVEAYYAARGKRARRCGIRAVPCMEPSVGQAILREMLTEAGVTLYERAAMTSSASDATGARPRVVAVEAYQAPRARVLRFEADVFVDATEYGDLLPLVPVRHRIGNSTSDALDRSACVQDITYAPIIKRYPGGAPADLRITAPPPGYGAEVEAKFAAIVALGGHDWDAEGWGGGYPVDWTTHVSYRATPDSSAPGDSTQGDSSTITKTGVNWANDFDYTVEDMIGRRFEANCAAKLHTLQFLYYAQNVLGETGWSVANDEGYDSPYNVEDNDCPEIAGALDALERHFPPIPYVRESRRIVGLHTLTASEIRRPGGGAPSTTNFPTSVAVASYAVDLHDCDAESELEAGLETASDRPDGFVGGAFQIPFESFIPADVDGLLPAEKNLSQSRFVSGATRLQPSTMHTGHAAGAIAALASSMGRAPRDVHPLEVQLALIDAGLHVGVRHFDDVPHDGAYWPGVEIASARDILVGTGGATFGVSDPLGRAQAAVWLARLLELDISSPPSSPTFGDVSTGHFAYAHVEAVYRAGITSGCSASPRLFCPSDPLTRAQAATMLARGLGFDPATAPTSPIFDDVPSTSPHFPAIQWLASNGLVNGCATSPARFCPSDPLRRGQAALLTRRALEHRLLGR